MRKIKEDYDGVAIIKCKGLEILSQGSNRLWWQVRDHGYRICTIEVKTETRKVDCVDGTRKYRIVSRHTFKVTLRISYQLEVEIDAEFFSSSVKKKLLEIANMLIEGRLHQMLVSDLGATLMDNGKKQMRIAAMDIVYGNKSTKDKCFDLLELSGKI